MSPYDSSALTELRRLSIEPGLERLPIGVGPEGARKWLSADDPHQLTFWECGWIAVHGAEPVQVEQVDHTSAVPDHHAMIQRVKDQFFHTQV